MSSTKYACWSLLCAALAGCGSTTEAPATTAPTGGEDAAASDEDSALGEDAVGQDTATPTDGAKVDTATPLDTGSVDTGSVDTGAPLDTGAADATAVDTGSALDGNDPLDVHEPNDTAATATTLTVGAAPLASVLSTKADVDWFELTTPSDGASGYVKAKVLSTTCDTYATKVYVGAFTTPINNHIMSSIAHSARSTFTFAAAPNTKYRLEVAAVGSFAGSCAYTIEAAYTKLDDPYEGTTAAPITKNVAVKAYYSTGFLEPSAYSRDALRDGFTVDLVAGSVSVGVSPPYYSGQTNVCISFAGPGLSSSIQNCATPGQSPVIATSVSATGTYNVWVSHSSSPPSGFYYNYGASLAAEFTPYTLNVTQN